MAQISRDDVLHLAQLSRLQLSEEEVDSLAEDITNILGYVEQLDELDITNVEPSYQVTSLSSVMREDSISTDDVSRESLLVLSSDASENQVKVPKVL